MLQINSLALDYFSLGFHFSESVIKLLWLEENTTNVVVRKKWQLTWDKKLPDWSWREKRENESCELKNSRFSVMLKNWKIFGFRFYRRAEKFSVTEKISVFSARDRTSDAEMTPKPVSALHFRFYRIGAEPNL